MSNNTPSTWVETKLSEINCYVSKTLNPENFKSEKFELYSVPSYSLGTPEFLVGEAIGSSKQIVKQDDVLICKINPRINRVWKVGVAKHLRQIASSEWIVVRAPALNSDYLKCFFSSPKFRGRITQDVTGVGGSLTRAQPKNVSTFQVPIAPINEQKRIAEKLDRVLARVDSCQSHLERVPQILNRFRQSVLEYAMAGSLTEEWRGKNKLSLGDWETKRGEEVFPFITSGSRGWAKYYSDTGAKFIRVGNLDHNTIEIDFNEVQYVAPPVGAEGERTRIETGDILISITADIGMIGLVRKNIDEAYINQHVALARQTGEYNGAFLAYYLASPNGGIQQFTKAQKGMTKAGLTLGDIRNLEIHTPQMEEQIEIVCRVEKLFTYANHLEARWQAGNELVEKLTPSLLAKAFRGELVEQDPDDEPAEALLERIRLERGKAQAEKKKTEQKFNLRKPKELKMTEDTVKDIILMFPEDTFSFDELREKIPGDYEQLKEILFSLLIEDNPIIIQVFDQTAKAMRFVRTSK